MVFLGTGASEGIPNPFCRCRICETARKKGGKEVRTRSSFMLDEKTVIDMGADYFIQSYLRGIPFDTIENVIFTHMHTDHMNYHFIWERFVRLAGGENPVNIWLSEDAYRYFTEVYDQIPIIGCTAAAKEVVFHPMKYGEQYQIGKYQVMPLRGFHHTELEPNSTNYVIRDENKSLYYAVDSGYFLEETFEKLAGMELDTLIMECTFAILDKPTVTEKTEHNDPFMCERILDRLSESRAITEKTQVYYTHIGSFQATHEELCAFVASRKYPFRITVAYDGMNIE